MLFIRRPAEKKVETVEPKKTGRKPRVPKKSTALVPTAPAAVKQAEFDFVKDVKGREWDYCALVTNDEKMDALALSQLYRDRGDCENSFDEFKNQWGWSGFTTHKLKRCRTMARLNSGNDGDLYYMRTSHGVEIDVVVENAGKLDLTEVKAGETFHDEMADNLRSISRLLPNEVGKLSVVYAGNGASASGGIPVMSFEKIDFTGG